MESGIPKLKVVDQRPSSVCLDLQPGSTVSCRYNTRNFHTKCGTKWRKLTVLRVGNSKDTEMGERSKKKGEEGIWAVEDDQSEKFFVYDRFIDS